MDELTSLYIEAENEKIVIDPKAPKGYKASIFSFSNLVVIGIDESGTTQDEKIQLLYHELGHYYTGTYYSIASPLQSRAQAECRAIRWEIIRRIPKEQLQWAVSRGCLELWELAEYFGVDEKLMAEAIKYYKMTA